jgi:hypothetical protein
VIMSYLLYRIRESNGFLAKRAIMSGFLEIIKTYGIAFRLGNCILTPDMVYDVHDEEVM